MNSRFRLALAAWAMAFAVLSAPATGFGQQRSINLQVDIGRTFDAVEKNKTDFEAAAQPARRRIEDLAKQSENIRRRMDQIPFGLSDEERGRRERGINAEAVENAAEYVKTASAIVNHASKLIAGNMMALDALSRRIADARLGAPDMEVVKKRIAQQAAMGRRVVGEIREIAKLAEKEPALRRRLNSLLVSAGAIDRSITAQKKRLEADIRDGIGGDTGRIAGMLQTAVNELADYHVALEAERALLRELKEEVELAVQLGTIDITREVIAKSLPTLTASGGESVVPGLDSALDGMRDLTRRMIDSGNRPAEAVSPSGGIVAPIPNVPTFKNF